MGRLGVRSPSSLYHGSVWYVAWVVRSGDGVFWGVGRALCLVFVVVGTRHAGWTCDFTTAFQQNNTALQKHLLQQQPMQ